MSEIVFNPNTDEIIEEDYNIVIIRRGKKMEKFYTQAPVTVSFKLEYYKDGALRVPPVLEVKETVEKEGVIYHKTIMKNWWEVVRAGMDMEIDRITKRYMEENNKDDEIEFSP